MYGTLPRWANTNRTEFYEQAIHAEKDATNLFQCFGYALQK